MLTMNMSATFQIGDCVPVRIERPGRNDTDGTRLGLASPGLARLGTAGRGQ
jgi:hypothetical protein